MCEYLSKKKILIAVFVAILDEISGGSENFTWKEICKIDTDFLKIIKNF